MWQYAVLFPDPYSGWEWTTKSLLGIPALVRVLVALARAGVQEVWFPAGSYTAQQVMLAHAGRSDLPKLRWKDENAWPTVTPGTVFLGVRGGMLFTSHLVCWLSYLSVGKTSATCAISTDGLPVMLTIPAEVLHDDSHEKLILEYLASQLPTSTVRVPPDVFCQPIQAFQRPQDDRMLLAAVGKPTDRWHVQWVRGWAFPVLRLLTRLHITPNQISVLGFLVALFACSIIAQGAYWTGICGALLLYTSWVLDCLDGTLARLTLTESAFGQQLDTTLGHLTNLCIFAALIWAVYGDEPPWKIGAVVCILFGGIVIAQRITVLAKQGLAQHTASQENTLRRVLAKINHRDYAVIILLLAVFDAVRIFLWLSMIGVHVYWLLHLWTLRKQTQATPTTY